MISWIIDWSLKNRALVLLLAAALAVAGSLALRATPVDAIPDLSDTQVVIRTAFPGQAPELVEQQLTYPLSSALMAVPQAKTVRGYSFFGDSFVYVLFEDGTDPYWARSRVLEALSQAGSDLPTGVQPRLGPDATGVGWVYEYALIDRSGQQDLADLTSLQNWLLKYELQSVDGVAEIATVGGLVREYQIVIDPDRLRQHKLSMRQLISAVRAANQESGGALIEMAEAEYMVRASGYLSSLEDFETIPLISDSRGNTVTLGELAEIRLGPKLRRGLAELNGEGEVVGGIVIMRQGANARATIAAVRDRLDALQGSLPPGVEIITTYDRSQLIDRAIATLKKTLIEELVIVALICGLFLMHGRSALVAMVSLPLGILSAFLIMRWQGLNANIMSLGGIAIAIGAMVDGAIVMVENLHVHLAAKDARRHWQRVRDAAQEVGPALFFSLAIITVSFLPVFSLQAEEGRLFAPLAFTKTYAMAAAAGLAISLTPVLMGLLIRGRVPAAEDNPLNRGMLRLYRPLLNKALAHPRSSLACGLIMALSGIYPASQMGSEFMPPLDEGDWMYMPTTRPGISIGAARQLLQQTDKLIKSVPEVDTVFGKIGRAETATDPAPLTMIETTIQFKPPSQWREGMDLEAIRDEIRQRVQVPGLSGAWVMPIRTRIDMLATGIKTPVGIKILGPDLATIQSLGRDLEEILSDFPGTASAYAERVEGGRYVKIDIDRVKAGRYGLNIAELQSIVQSAVGGMRIGETIEARERYPITMRYPQSWRDSPEALRELPLITPQGAHILLGDVALIGIEPGPPMIKSENARLSGWVLVDVENIDLGTYVNQAKQHVQQHLQLPAGYTLQWTGQYEYLQRAEQQLRLVVPATLAVIALLLFLAFSRLGPVLILMASVPVALSGGLWLVWAMNFNLSVAVVVGFIALAGVAVEIGVVMFSYLDQECAKPSSASRLERIRHGAERRLRAIIMTSVATIAGLIPIMLSSGTGSEVMQRIAAPMIGGMLSTLVLALLVLPAAYLLWQSAREPSERKIEATGA